jgi:predicted nucleic acid-binding protein
VPTKGTAIFLDTSIQIARFIHSPEAKRRIDERIREFDLKVTSSVVRQEFKRRLLRESKYVLEQLSRRNSYAEVYHHIVQLPDLWHKRKKNICLRMFE